jgi:type II secretory pathway pseudopilin PulG
MQTMQRTSTRRGISLLEVLISIGIIALGILPVALLIPVAQSKVEQGIAADRQATLGNRAVADFRIRNMGSPRNWRVPNASVAAVFDSKGEVIRRGYCLDPTALVSWTDPSPPWFFPHGTTSSAALLRITLKSLTASSVSEDVRRDLARQVFDLRDDLVFDRPVDQSQFPRRQFFVNPTDGTPVRTHADGSMSWFATVTPTISNLSGTNDSFLLSVVVVRGRVTSPTEEGIATASSQFAGEVTLTDLGTTSSEQIRVADLRIGDWILLAKPLPDLIAKTSGIAYRWTKIIGADENDGVIGVARTFTIANNDFFRPVTTASDSSGQAILVRGVSGVYERTIRLQTDSAWD